MNYSVVIVAAGKGSRMGLGYNKVYYKLDDEKTVIEETISKFDDDRCKQVIVVCDIQDFVSRVGLKCKKIVLAKGGITRQESVYNGLKAVSSDVVLIHDGARPFVSKKCIDDVLLAMGNHDAAFVCVKVKDTIKVVREGKVIDTIDRDSLRSAQTPQAFKTEKILECFKNAMIDGFTGTDDCSVFEKYSDSEIIEVEGDYNNIKLTTVEDLL